MTKSNYELNSSIPWKHSGHTVPSDFNELCILIRINTGTAYKWFTHIIPKAVLDPDSSINRLFMGGTFFNAPNSAGYCFDLSLNGLSGFVCYWAQTEVTSESGYNILYR